MPPASKEDELRIVGARNSLFEVDVDLGSWEGRESNTIPDFPRELTNAIPSLWEHKCITGQPGGFVKELQQGTHLAHVVEHVLLELLHLADPEQRTYTGWTTPKTNGDEQPVSGIYTIHFQIKSSSQGELAAQAGIEIVQALLRGAKPRVQRQIARLKETF